MGVGVRVEVRVRVRVRVWLCVMVRSSVKLKGFVLEVRVSGYRFGVFRVQVL